MILAIYCRYGATEHETCESREEARHFLQYGADYGHHQPVAILDGTHALIAACAPVGTTNEEYAADCLELLAEKGYYVASHETTNID